MASDVESLKRRAEVHTWHRGDTRDMLVERIAALEIDLAAERARYDEVLSASDHLASELAALTAQVAERDKRIAVLEEALEPFAAAGRAIPEQWVDARPAAHVNADASKAGSVTTIPTADFRRAARTTEPAR